MGAGRTEFVCGLQLGPRTVIYGRTLLRLTLSQVSVGSGDCWIVATSGHRVTPRSDRNLSMTPSSSARRGPTRIGALVTRRIAGALTSTSSRPIGNGSRSVVLGVGPARSHDACAMTGRGFAPPLPPAPLPPPPLPPAPSPISTCGSDGAGPLIT